MDLRERIYNSLDWREAKTFWDIRNSIYRPKSKSDQLLMFLFPSYYELPICTELNFLIKHNYVETEEIEENINGFIKINFFNPNTKRKIITLNHKLISKPLASN